MQSTNSRCVAWIHQPTLIELGFFDQGQPTSPIRLAE